ncbi:MAG: hypothetical protein ACLTMP_08625 [Eggerthella lenta]
MYESNGFTLFDTHYYGGIKNYQWVTLPLALHGVIAKKDGTVVDVKVGDDPDDPVFCVTDLLIHLAGKQMAKKANEVVEGEDLDIPMGNRPLTCGSGSLDGTQSLGSPGSHGQSAGLSGSCGTRLVGTAEAPGESAGRVRPRMSRLLPVKKKRRPVKAFALKLLAEKYGTRKIISPPRSRSCLLTRLRPGFDRSMVRLAGRTTACAPTRRSWRNLRSRDGKTAVCVLVTRRRSAAAPLAWHRSSSRTPWPRSWSLLARRPLPLAARAALHAVVRRVRRLRPRQHVRGEELRVFGARPGVNKYGQPRQGGSNDATPVRGAHPPRHG